MKPVYANKFFISKNYQNKEVILEFKHSYIENSISSENNTAIITKNSKTEDVASLCFCLSDVISLRNALNEVIESLIIE